jgi:hypothetical protein
MTRRIAFALPLGLIGVLAYITAAVALADHVLALHWSIQAIYFLVAGLAWAMPIRWLILWAGHAR